MSYKVSSSLDVNVALSVLRHTDKRMMKTATMMTTVCCRSNYRSAAGLLLVAGTYFSEKWQETSTHFTNSSTS